MRARIPSRRRAADLLMVAVAAALLIELGAVLASGWEAPSGALGGTMAPTILVLPVLAFFLCATEQPSRRRGWP